MKKYDLVYDPKDGADGILFNNIEIDKLVGGITIERQSPVASEDQVFSKNKSEVVEYENEEYAALKEEEQNPYIVTDANTTVFSGKFQKINDSSSVYFVLVNTGNQLRMVPITKRYAFVRKGIVEDENIEALDKKLATTHAYIEENDDDDESDDYKGQEHALGDDDDEDAKVVYAEKEKVLSGSGRAMKKLVDTLGNEEMAGDEGKDEGAGDEGKKMRLNESLTKEKLKKIFENRKMTIKDLLRQIKSEYALNDEEKALIREFMCESCTFEINKKTGDKLFKLK